MPVFTSPLSMLRNRPITAGMTLLVAIYSEWLGFLICDASKLPPVRLLGYAGPMSLFPLHTWGHLFMLAGLCFFGRLFIPAIRQTASVALHMLGMMVSLAWALAFDLGKPSTGQAAYTFEAIVVFGIPFASQVLDRYYVHLGRKR